MAGKVVALSRWKGRVENRIGRIGMELEGAWPQLPPGVPQLDQDMSVYFLKGDRNKPLFNTTEIGTLKIGELASPPLEKICVPSWLKQNYPLPGGKIHAYCGLHVHMSFPNPRHYCQLADTPDYQETLLWELTEWAKGEGSFQKKHHIWGRLEGKDEYCTKNFWPEEQMKSDRDHDRTRHGNRYTAVNFCWKAHGTVEVRVLPMMENVDLAIRAVTQVLDVTNAYLVATAAREEKLFISIPSAAGLKISRQVRRLEL